LLSAERAICKNCEHRVVDHDSDRCGIGVEVDEGWARCGCTSLHRTETR
jgi:hypothetical protein